VKKSDPTRPALTFKVCAFRSHCRPRGPKGLRRIFSHLRSRVLRHPPSLLSRRCGSARPHRSANSRNALLMAVMTLIRLCASYTVGSSRPMDRAYTAFAGRPFPCFPSPRHPDAQYGGDAKREIDYAHGFSAILAPAGDEHSSRGKPHQHLDVASFGRKGVASRASSRPTESPAPFQGAIGAY
jgi:hypothetical protein